MKNSYLRENERWTTEEEQYLHDNYGTMSIGAIARNLQRSNEAIVVRANRLELGAFLECGDYVTFNQLLYAAMGNNSGSAYKNISWIKNRDFPIRYQKVNKCRFKVVRLDEFWEWAKNNQDLMDFSKFEENSLGEEPAWAKEKRKRDYENSRKFKTTPWTKVEDADLMRYMEKGTYTYKQLSKMLGRTEGAIARRILDLGIKNRPVKAGSHNLYTEEEIEQLGEMIKAGYGYNLIAEKMQRSSKAIRGLVFRYYSTENLDKVRSYVANDGFGDNRPEKMIKNINSMDAAEKRETKLLLSNLAAVLQMQFEQEKEKAEHAEGKDISVT